MIRELKSDLASFKHLTFGPGLNIILADKSPDATDLQSRNGAGKTSFVELVHFLLGAEAKPRSIFRSEALSAWTFSASLDISRSTCSISRSGKRPSHIQIDGNIGDWPVVGQHELLPSSHQFSNDQWSELLGALWFAQPPDTGAERFRPTFRSLFSFVARRQESGGFQHPMQHSTMQQRWDRQAAHRYDELRFGADGGVYGWIQSSGSHCSNPVDRCDGDRRAVRFQVLSRDHSTLWRSSQLPGRAALHSLLNNRLRTVCVATRRCVSWIASLV